MGIGVIVAALTTMKIDNYWKPTISLADVTESVFSLGPHIAM